MSLLRPTLTALGAASAAVTIAIGAYRSPVAAPVVDPFRPPPSPWAAGNRGIDYATPAGTVVEAAAGGVVDFAGPVGGSLHVVVRHPDGVRTSYSFLSTILVHRGEAVTRGEPVGTAGVRFHFGARVGDRYVDPAGLLEATPPSRVHLVGDGDGSSPAPH